ncbi:MAG: class I SAM-dependent methyltransferase [Candidatus Shapirobacteria bacterium]|jgi:ubiquinone/menaquinone biosynthesis C-methylase UbiE
MTLSSKYWLKSCAGYIKLLHNPQEYPSPYSVMMIPTLKELVKKYTQKNDSLIDIGCGEGFFTREIKKIRPNISGYDISAEMIVAAKEKNSHIHYQQLDIEKSNLQISKSTYNLAISSLVFHYLEKIDSALKNIHHLLVDQGYLIVTIPHPCFYHPENFDWFQNENNQDYQLGKYFNEGVTIRNIAKSFKTHHIHRTIGSYVRTFSKNKFEVVDILEPRSKNKTNQTLTKADNIPFMAIFVLQKKA